MSQESNDQQGYSQPGYDQQGYGQPQQGYSQPAAGYAQAEHPQAQTVLILGIVGIFVGVLSFVAWYLGGKAKKEIKAGAPYQFTGGLKTGYMLGKIFSIIWIILVALWLILVIIGIVLAASSGTTY